MSAQYPLGRAETVVAAIVVAVRLQPEKAHGNPRLAAQLKLPLDKDGLHRVASPLYSRIKRESSTIVPPSRISTEFLPSRLWAGACASLFKGQFDDQFERDALLGQGDGTLRA